MHINKSLPLNETDQVFYCYLIDCHRNLTSILNINRRMPKCNTVLQSENDLFEPEIRTNSHGNC